MRNKLSWILWSPFYLIRPFFCHAVWTYLKLRQLRAVRMERIPRIEEDFVNTPATGGIYAIYAVYGKLGIGKNAFKLFDILKQEGINVIVVVNGSLIDNSECDMLKTKVHRYIRRKNLGRDFGAYRSALLQLYNENAHIDRIIFLNDSIYYIDSKELHDLVRKLKGRNEYDVIAATENHEFYHHYGTFAFSLSGKVLFDEMVQKFWHNFVPYNLRVHAIHCGEIGIGKIIKNRGFSCEVVYGSERLADILDNLPLEEILRSLKLLAFGVSDVGALIKSVEKTIPKTMRNHARFLRNLNKDRSHNTEMNTVQQTAEDSLRAINDTSYELFKKFLIVQIIRVITRGSQIHLGFGHFHRFMSLPLVKKDLFYRDIYLESELPIILNDLEKHEQHEIIRNMINRGKYSRYTYLRENIIKYLKLD